jgi:hypothetical protein
MDELKTLDEALKQLIGEQLSSVEFVQDYLQLRFDGPCLNVYSGVHRVTSNLSSLVWGQPGYRDALCGLISRKVKKTEVLSDERISFIFDDESVWSMSLRKEDYRGPEAFEFRAGMLWFVG